MASSTSMAQRASATIMIVAGEASGDLHGSHLVYHLRELRPETRFFGIGGEAMARQGVELAFDCSELAVVGLTEIVGKLRTLYHAFTWIKRTLASRRPDAVILIDFPDFNLRVARLATRMGIPVVYYIAPQVWAWRRGRVKKIAQRVSKLLVIFPFEEMLFRDAGVDVTYVGHPLLDALEAQERSCEQFYAQWDLSPLYPIVGLFPGSRPREVDALLPAMLEAAVRLGEKFQHMQFLLGKAPSLDAMQIRRHLEVVPIGVRTIDEHIHMAMRMCDVAIVASGTATLELALWGVPMVIVYKVSPLTYLVGRTLVRVPSIGLANLVSGKQVVPELIQGDVTGGRIFEACLPLLTDAVYRAQIKKELQSIRTMLGTPGASKRAAESVQQVLDRSVRLTMPVIPQG